MILITVFLDWISFFFISFVLLISAFVIYYRIEYIRRDLFINRFIFLVVLFVFSIIFLILRPNLIRILLGWDGLGLVSYCLVIYFQNVKSYNAGILTALSNRVGDVALLIAIAWILNIGSWRFIFYLEFIKNSLFFKFVGILVILAAFTKRAQIPFSSWLPAAIAAPTPVSALVHSSTLVTAGVYLLIRFNVLFIDSVLREFILLVGGLTIFIAGLSANFEFDLKKIIALSTLSQLGLIVRILGLGFNKLAFFHLLTHALFKALLFLCAGLIIHKIKNFQDIRKMGGLVNFLPFSRSCFNISNLALCGLPFLAGFYSKDLILEVSAISSLNYLSFFLFFLSTGLTVSYSFRLAYYLFTRNFNSFPLIRLNDERTFIFKRIMGLLIAVIFIGSSLIWLIFPSPTFICLPSFLKILTLLVCILGGILGYYFSFLSLRAFNKSKTFYFFMVFFSLILFLPWFSTKSLRFKPLLIGNLAFKSLDQGWSEFLGGQKIFFCMKHFSLVNQLIQKNF